MRLVNRYGQFRLDAGVLGDDRYPQLQTMGVLARVDHQLLAGSTVDLTAKELENLQRTRRLPASVLDRVGRDSSRNDVLLRSIHELPADWPVLLFATSVDHAQTMAALLQIAGISAAPISGETDPGARRHYIEAFRRGAIPRPNQLQRVDRRVRRARRARRLRGAAHLQSSPLPTNDRPRLARPLNGARSVASSLMSPIICCSSAKRSLSANLSISGAPHDLHARVPRNPLPRRPHR